MQHRRPSLLAAAASYRCCHAVVLAMVALAAMLAIPSLACAEYLPIVTTHGGPVETKPHVFEIYWGRKWGEEPAAGERPTLEALYRDFSGSGWEGTIAQYWGAEGFGGAEGFVSKEVVVAAPYSDENEPPAEVGYAAMEAQVKAAVEAAHGKKLEGWPASVAEATVNDQFVLLTTPGTMSQAAREACGEHLPAKEEVSYGKEAEYVYDLIPWEDEKSKERDACTHTFVASHEFAEAASDPRTNGWRNWSTKSEEEIADLCPTPVTLDGIEVTELASDQLYKETNEGPDCVESDASPSQVAPEIVTEGTSEVSKFEARIEGKATPNGLDIEKYAFEYRKSESEGFKQVPERGREESWLQGAEGQRSRKVGARLSGLEPGTTYHYRLLIFDDDGTPVEVPQVEQRGAIREFKTAAAVAPVVATEPAFDIDASGATVGGSVDPEGAEAKYYFEYGLEEGKYEHRTPEMSAGSGTTAVQESEGISGLAPGTIYYYRIVATNRGGTTEGRGEMFATAATTPVFAGAFGVEGTGNGQFEHPRDVAVDSKGDLWVVESRARVQEFNERGEYVSQFAIGGVADSIAVGVHGDLWVTDSYSHRIDEYTPEGAFVLMVGGEVNETKVEKGGSEAEKDVCTAVSGNTCQAGKAGSGNGQFGNGGPEGIAVDSKGHVWTSDTYNARLEEFGEAGEFLRVAGSYGSGPGQFEEPQDIAVNAANNIYVADWSNNRVTELNESGGYVREFGEHGSGNGQLSQPYGIAVDSQGNVWVGDTANNRVEEFSGTGVYITKFGEYGSGNGQFRFSYPIGLAINARGDMWVTDPGGARIQAWTP